MSNRFSFLVRAWIAVLLVAGLSSCSSGWTEEERAAFSESCIQSARGLNEGWPNETCACITNRLEKEHPNPNDIESFLDSIRTNPVLLFDRYPQCRVRTFETAAEWTPVSEAAFMKSCGKATQYGTVPDSALCPCILEKVKKRFPTDQSIHRLNTQVLGFLAEECQGKRAPQLY